LNRRNTSFPFSEATSGFGRFASPAAPGTTITVSPVVGKPVDETTETILAKVRLKFLVSGISSSM